MSIKPGLDLENFDKSVRPQDDLFLHTNGKWKRETEIPADQAMHGSFHMLRDASEEAVKEIGAVVEGYYAAESAREMAKKAGVELPIVNAAYDVLYEDEDPRETVRLLMTREKRHEMENPGWDS